jgi:thiol:disulfide interchange protein DsbD
MFNKSLFLFLLLPFLSLAQMIDPVKWSASAKQTAPDEITIAIDAKIDQGWHLYSQKNPEGGALPLEFDWINKDKDYQLIGKTSEPKYKKGYSEAFKTDEYYFEKQAHFTQKIKLLKKDIKTLEVDVFGQACIEGKCVQTGKVLKVILPILTATTAADEQKEVPLEVIKVDTLNQDSNQSVVATTDNKSSNSIENNIKEIAPKREDKKGLWGIFIAAFLSGFLALLTPCVFPMIPLTVSFFTKQSGTRQKGIRNALLYGLSIVIIYVGLGAGIVAIFGPTALNKLSTSVIFNLIFFGILVVFAISFLGAFEITLPQSWANKIDAQSNKSGLVGIFFMALALAVVSFSCTGPIVGTLLVEAASKGGIAPIVGMLGFSLAIALPFMFFALFPGYLNSLPKSGGWMNTVKVSLGFLELALAFKFLSNADLVMQAHYLEREPFLAIWIAVFATWSLYLFGKITLPHDSPLTHISVGRLFMGLLVLIFTIYLVPGLWGAPLKIIDGIPPPMEYSESPEGIGKNSYIGNDLAETKRIAHGLQAFTDYEKGMAYAKKVNKPLFIDFTGHACANCRRMEGKVWSDKSILKQLKNDVVIVSLYVDERKKLPKSEQYVSKTTGERIKTVGDKWSDFQITRYQTNSQPQYIMLNHEEKEISPERIGYNPDINFFNNWLMKSVDNFNN